MNFILRVLLNRLCSPLSNKDEQHLILKFLTILHAEYLVKSVAALLGNVIFIQSTPIYKVYYLAGVCNGLKSVKNTSVVYKLPYKERSQIFIPLFETCRTWATFNKDVDGYIGIFFDILGRQKSK